MIKPGGIRMKVSTLYSDGLQTFVVVFASGEAFMAGMEQIAAQHRLDAAQFTAIGAFRSATLGFFDVAERTYREIPVDEQVEVLSLIGNIAIHRGKPKVHAHVVVGRSDGTTRGGHLLEAFVHPTLEVVVTETPAHLRREVDEATGLPLIRLEES